ncbi:ATP-binding protein [Thermogemmatispora sp.]|uniref:GAF domain-containing sensor histidine kinase n=1 Tax=Thermogemmatispora sp. TaxID=1968838 RepID=UPI001DA2B6F4|nr:ATP-binding protein [Thermogemmatispora sp.]MBX5448910.1 GAF domain-containing protein [Thermogemmatispora sp.]
MPTAIWGEPEPEGNEAYPLATLKQLLHQMMVHFAAQGACLALYDALLGQMVIRLHVRLRNGGAGGQPSSSLSAGQSGVEGVHRVGRRTTINLQDPSSSAIGRLKRTPAPQDELEDVPPQPGSLFPVGSRYAPGQDLIGYVWRENRSCIMEHESYIYAFHGQRKMPFPLELRPHWYFAAPIQEPLLAHEESGQRVAPQPPVLGVVVLYKLVPAPGFDLKQRQEVHAFTERMALYLENHRLRQIQRRTSEHLQSLQQLSAIFPSTVNLAYLLEQVYQFTRRIVDVSAMLVTLYDRDTRMIYDVYAVRDGKPVEGLPTESVEPRTRRQWWRVTQEEKRTLLLSPAHLRQHEYDELLQGVWGDQRQAESFLLLPMKMFNRVIGSVSLASQRPNAYRHEDIQVLETMVQIITVGIENARLYERSRRLLRKARQREESLAAMNSALQSISLVLNVREMLDNFVRAVANLVEAEVSVFFQLSADKEELVAQAIYARSNKGASNEALSFMRADSEKERELIEMIRLPFKGSLLERMASEGAFFYLDAALAEELAQTASEGGAIFLRETQIQRMIMIPVQYQTELMGILALHTPRQDRVFQPEEIGMLLAICSQAASAIRNAQLFEQIQEANAELQRMNTLKDEFIVTASHELRTPLSAISGYASLLKRQSARATPQQILRFASKIAASAQQLSALVANMTEAANMDALGRKLELHPSPVELRTAVQMAVSILSINIEQQIEVNVPEGIWLYCDPQLLRQVLTNLLDNAAKYSPPDSQIEIRVREMTLGEVPLPEEQVDHEALIEKGADLPVAVVSVCDQGEGILPEEQHKIFEKFVRASRTLTTPVRGSGLGLYICRRFIEAMGGKLWLERSVPGEGSIFSFYLPRTSPPPEAREQEEEEPASNHEESA